MNVVRKKAPRIDFTATNPSAEDETVEIGEEETVETAPKETGNSVSKTVEEVEPKDEKPPPKVEMVIEDNIFNMGTTTEIPKSKKKKKKVLSQKQLDHLARCREKALAKKKAMRAVKEQEKAEKNKIKAENKAIREAKAKKKKEDDALIRKAQQHTKRTQDREHMFGILDEWYERKTKRKQARKKAEKPKAEIGGGGTKTTPPRPKNPATPSASQPMKFRNEWKDPFCNSKFSPFNPTFQRKKTRRGYLNY